MNVFFLDSNPIAAAKMLCDKHIVSQIGETRMILRTALYRLGCEVAGPPYNPNGRFARWASETRANFEWLCRHGVEITNERERRGYAEHSAEQELLDFGPRSKLVPRGRLTAFPHAIKRDGEQIVDVVAAYREYYIRDKARFAKWERGRLEPKWWPESSVKHAPAGNEFPGMSLCGKLWLGHENKHRADTESAVTCGLCRMYPDRLSKAYERLREHGAIP